MLSTMNIYEKVRRKCDQTDNAGGLMPQLDCSSQPFFLLYLILFSSHFIFCDLQREKTRKASWPMVYSHSDPAPIRVTDVLLFSCPEQTGQQHWG